MTRLVVLRLDVHDLERLRDTGVVDEDVDVAELRDHRRGRAFAVRLAGDIACDADVAGADIGGGRFSGPGVQVEDGDAGAVLGEEPRGGLADAARGRGPGDDCDFVLQQHGGLQRGLNVGRMLRLHSIASKLAALRPH